MLDTDPHAAAIGSQETAEAPAVVGLAECQKPRSRRSPRQMSRLDAAVAPAAPPSEAMPFEQNAVEAGQDVPEPDFASSSLTDADFESLRVQLAEVSAALARKASSEARVIKQLRSALDIGA